MATSVVQLRIDDDLKNQAIAVYDRLGIDLSTAIRIFIKRSVDINGIPFPMILPKEYDSVGTIAALRKIQDSAEKNGISNMSLDEINEEIAAARREHRQRRG